MGHRNKEYEIDQSFDAHTIVSSVISEKKKNRDHTQVFTLKLKKNKNKNLK